MSAPQKSSVNTSGYREVDAAEQERQQWMFRFLGLQSNMRSNQEMKAIAIERLGLRPGDAVLEVGCGLGDDVRTLAGLVGPSGKAVGLDPSRLFLDEAPQRGVGPAGFLGAGGRARSTV